MKYVLTVEVIFVDTAPIGCVDQLKMALQKAVQGVLLSPSLRNHNNLCTIQHKMEIDPLVR